MENVTLNAASASITEETPLARTPSKGDGRAYGMRIGKIDEELVRCGPGTPGGELLRRYWQPIAASSDVKDLPREMRLLGEDLILYRDRQGTPGLLYSRCVHRGTSLLYGKIEEKGIRCCYHGWLFDEEGRCMEMPCEPNNTRMMRNVRQPWYPVVEKWGLIFAYLGPPELQPEFPRFSIEDDLPDGHEILGVGTMDEPPPDAWVILGRNDYNWWQGFDNMNDPFHVYVLHSLINGNQFGEDFSILPDVKVEQMADGVRAISHRDMGDGTVLQRIGQSFLPNMSSISTITNEPGPPNFIGWHVPRDDTSFRFFSIHVMPSARGKATHAFGTDDEISSIPLFSSGWGPGKPSGEWTLEDWQRWQCDYVAQKGQGTITLHSEEHLAETDRSMSIIRRMFKQQARAVADGKNPVGSAPGESYEYVTTAGNAVFKAATMEYVKGFDGR